MKTIIMLILSALMLPATSLRAQLLLSPGQSYAYEFSSLQSFGDGYASPNARGFATFHTDSAQSTPGATYTVQLFENSLSDPALASVTGSGNVTANAVNAWQDFTGIARVTVDSGDVFFNSLVANVYRPSGFGDYELHSTGIVPVPEPGTMTLAALGVLTFGGAALRKRRK
jgi:hypothetical protein